jgi:hypothetical protein
MVNGVRVIDAGRNDMAQIEKTHQNVGDAQVKRGFGLVFDGKKEKAGDGEKCDGNQGSHGKGIQVKPS